ncbi:MAG: hypothetical protein HKN36_04945 [Hellea sp.]|nr:hypothetical protein [Hellea sp.]
MKIFDDHSLAWFIGGIALMAVYFIIRAMLGYKQIARDADAEYSHRKAQGTVDKRLSREGYVRAYRRYYAPRNLTYIGITLAMILFLTPLLVMLYGIVSTKLWEMAGQPLEYAPSSLVWQFFMYFSVIGMWGLIAYQVAKIYHKKAPRTLRDEMLREME